MAQDPTPQKGIVIENSPAREGEREGTNMRTVEENLLKPANMSQKCKVPEPRKTRGVQVDY